MRNIIILFMLALFPIVGYAGIDEYKTDVYFANGIQTEDWEARKNARDVLKPAIIEKFGIKYYNNYIGKVDYAYNNTNKLALDLWESIAQKLNFQELIDVIFDTSHGRDLAKQITAYKNSIEDGHKVLVVAHSQGNLFTAEALNSLQGWMHDYFCAVSVASPKAFKIKSDTPHIAFDNDIVPWLGGVYIATDNPNGEVGSLDSHAFTYYMGLPSAKSHKSTDVAKIKIMSAVDMALNTLDKTSSQWETDKLNEATQEHLIKVIHKFDFTNIAMFDDVYPFNSEKKLYQVNGKYVKASSGGTKIFDADYDTWVDKKDNELYYLEGTGEVISEELASKIIVKYPTENYNYNIGSCSSNPKAYINFIGSVENDKAKYIKIVIDKDKIHYVQLSSNGSYWGYLPVINEELTTTEIHKAEYFIVDENKNILTLLGTESISFNLRVYKKSCYKVYY